MIEVVQVPIANHLDPVHSVAGFGLTDPAVPRAAAKTRWSVATTCAPSPTADATRFTEPERTSPIAKTPGRLVSKGCRFSLASAPVNTNPFWSNATSDPESQFVLGSAPMNRNRCWIG